MVIKDDYPEIELNDDLAAGEQEYWETIYRQIDDCFIQIGRMSKITDLMTEIVNQVNPKQIKRNKYADMVIPF